MSTSLNPYYLLLGKLERSMARRQGKGWGAGSVQHELNAAGSLTGKAALNLAIDVGGNVGNYTAAIRTAHPNAEVHMFEPSQTNIDALAARFGSDERVTVQPFALASSVMEATLFSDKPGSGLGSLTKRRLDHRGNDFDVSESVKTKVFDHYWKEVLRSRPIDLLKLDIEGHELDALNGSVEALAHTRVVQFEFGGCNIDTRTFFQDFWYFFRERNFDLYRITPRGVAKIDKYRERDEFFSTTNYLALAKDN
ncbi:MAG: FkbM family methyltransferase [Granulosicoccus sp.]|jgi:FkbM family methyltransferase